eukprot:COSAG05_NODE_26234_length_190_cov_19.879121_1_plen_46_part_10
MALARFEYIVSRQRVVGDENPEHSGKSGSEQKSSSNRTRTSILVAA